MGRSLPLLNVYVYLTQRDSAGEMAGWLESADKRPEHSPLTTTPQTALQKLLQVRMGLTSPASSSHHAGMRELLIKAPIERMVEQDSPLGQKKQLLNRRQCNYTKTRTDCVTAWPGGLRSDGCAPCRPATALC